MKHKALLLTALVLSISLLLCACGSASGSDSADSSSGGSTAAQPQSSAATDANEGDDVPDATAAEGPDDAQATASEAPKEKGEGEETAVSDDQVLYNGVVLAPGMDAAPVLEGLGDGYEYSENISCYFESGMDKTYIYPDLEIYTYPVSEDQDNILMINFTTDKVVTARDVKLGDSLDGVLLIYNDLLQSDGSDTRYTADINGVLLTITATDGAVDSISYELSETPAI